MGRKRSKGPDIGPLGPPPEAVVRLERVRPPYSAEPEPWHWVPQERLPSAAGLLITVDRPAPREEASSFQGFVGRFKRAYPAVPIALQRSGGGPWDERPTEPTEPTSSLSSPHVRGLLGDGFDAASYRALVGRYSTSSIREWLSTACEPVSVGEMGTVAWAARSVTDRASSVGDATASLRRHLRALELPTPSRWKMLREALRCVLALQRDQCTVEVARRGHYSHTRTLRRHCRDLFGEAPSTLRLWAGWEPLLARFVGVHVTGRSSRGRAP